MDRKLDGPHSQSRHGGEEKRILGPARNQKPIVHTTA